MDLKKNFFLNSMTDLKSFKVHLGLGIIMVFLHCVIFHVHFHSTSFACAFGGFCHGMISFFCIHVGRVGKRTCP